MDVAEGGPPKSGRVPSSEKGKGLPPEYQSEISRGLAARGILGWCGPTPKAIEAAPLRDRIARSSA
jgi:hypothetical protein